VFIGNLGFWELMVILAVALLVFGPQRLPDVGRALGQAFREIREAGRMLMLELDNGFDEDTSNDGTV